MILQSIWKSNQTKWFCTTAIKISCKKSWHVYHTAITATRIYSAGQCKIVHTYKAKRKQTKVFHASGREVTEGTLKVLLEMYMLTQFTVTVHSICLSCKCINCFLYFYLQIICYHISITLGFRIISSIEKKWNLKLQNNI